jgi:phosphoglucosamine mutase
MAVRFGTDGVRGRALTELTPEDVLAIGRASARVLGVDRMLIGRDPRLSGPTFEAALVAGITAEGVDVELLGVVPTPAVAWLAREDAAAAVMITASHNPWTDNGIKVFGAGGRKLADEQQRAIEWWCTEGFGSAVRPEIAVGRVRHRPEAAGRYVDAVVALIGVGALSDLHIVVDAANGAMGSVAGPVLEGLGARVDVLFASGAGDDVNAGCGATHPEVLCQRVADCGADLGLAFDGDGDRLIAVDHRGEVVDGDHLLALMAWDRHQRNRLPGPGVAVTVMTNLGFHEAMRAAGIEVITTPVGDRHVLEAMESSGVVLGGEQSGHIINLDLMPSGDGLVAGAVVADLVKRHARPLADLASSVMTAYPQVLVNLNVPAGRSQEIAKALQPVVTEVEQQLGGRGRVLVRPSGTEPLLRIMVEAPTVEQADAMAGYLMTQARHQAEGASPGNTAG